MARKKETNTPPQGAARRAQLAALLSQADKPLSIKEIMEATGWPESGTAYTATKAASAGLIQVRKDGLKNLYYMGNGEEPQTEDGQDGEVSVVKRRSRVTTAKEVELVVAGVLVILGRNPASGRLRIVLEEM